MKRRRLNSHAAVALIKRETRVSFGLLVREMDRRRCALASMLCCYCLVGLLLVGMPRKSQGYLYPRPDTYMTRWDKVNLDEILNSKRLLHYYFNCLMAKGPCPPDGHELKRVLPEALATGCAKCTKSQLEGAIKVIRYLREFETEKFEMLANRYDPDGKYRSKYLDSPPTNNEAY